MKILVLDKYVMRRDLAQMDMYFAMEEIFDLVYANEQTIYYLINKGNYDILYLGIYHHVMNVDFNRIFIANKKPVIIDQADNEEKATQKLKYDFVENKILLSRYLPNESLQKTWKGETKLLPWFVNPSRFKPLNKIIDASFVCSINGVRIGADRRIIADRLGSALDNAKLMYRIGSFYGNEYAELLGKTILFFIECGRKCLTQKYIEAALCECAIAGDVPIYPSNELKVMLFDFEKMEIPKGTSSIKYNKQYILDTFANKEVFLSNIKAIAYGMS